MNGIPWLDKINVAPDCEHRFRYRLDGKIGPTSEDDTGAVETIRHLKLDHLELRQMREQIIHEALFAKQLTEAQARRLMARDG